MKQCVSTRFIMFLIAPLGQVFRCHGYGLEVHLNQGAEMGMGLGVDRPVRNVRIDEIIRKFPPNKIKGCFYVVFLTDCMGE